MDDDQQPTADDALEETRPNDLYDPLNDESRLAEDNSSPAAPADDVPSLPLDDPATDTDEDADERYQEGEGEAADNSDREVGPDERPQPLEPED